MVMFSFTKKFIIGIFYYKRKYINNKEVAKIICKQVYKQYQKEGRKAKTEFEKISVKDLKLQKTLRDIFYSELNLILDPVFFDKMNTFGDIIEEIGNFAGLLVVKNTSVMYHFTKQNKNIYVKDLEPEDVLMYFIRNVKSDYYIAKHNLAETDLKFEEIDKEDIGTLVS